MFYIKMEVVLWMCFCLWIFNSMAQHPSLHSDMMSLHDKLRLRDIALEFIHKMKLRQRQLLPLKYCHMQTFSYQVGLIIGTMREKYRRMMDIYVENDRRHLRYTKVFGPGVWQLEPIHYVVAMEYIRLLEMEINKYVDLLEKTSDEEIDPNQASKSKMPKKPPKLGGLRSGNSNNRPPTAVTSVQLLPISRQYTVKMGAATAILTEEDIKRKYREDYKKRNGLQQDDWSLDRHYGFI